MLSRQVRHRVPETSAALLEDNANHNHSTAIADQYKNNRKEFDKNAKDWTKRYAK